MEYTPDLNMLSNHVDNLAQFVESFESLYQRCIGQREISLEGFKQYQTELTKLAYRHSFDISGTLDESSLESIYTLSFEADDQKKNIFRRVWDWFVSLLKQIWGKLSGNKDKHEKLSKRLEQMRVELIETVSRDTPTNTGKLKITIPKALANGWGYTPIETAENKAVGYMSDIIVSLKGISKVKNKNEGTRFAKEIINYGDKIHKLATDPKLISLVTDDIEIECDLAKFKAIAQYIKSVERMWSVSVSTTESMMGVFKATVDNLPKLGAVDGVFSPDELSSMTKSLNTAAKDMFDINLNLLACYTAYLNTIDRLNKHFK